MSYLLDKIVSPEVGQSIPMPENYSERHNRPDGLALLIITEAAPIGLAILIKDGVIVYILTVSTRFDVPAEGTYDAIIMNPDSIPPGAVEAAVAKVEKSYS